jgi:glucose-1-phosphate thymidylyltransferase
LRAAFDGPELSPEQESIAKAGIKALMPVGDGHVLLDLLVENLRNAGFAQICLVIGPEHDLIRDHCEKLGLRIDFRVQEEPLGTADAVLASESFVGTGELFAVVNSDNLYPADCLQTLRQRGEQGLLAFERAALIAKSNIPEERIAKFATVEIRSDGYLLRITEKPAAVDEKSYVSMNAWLFSSAIFDACRAIEPSVRGELELTSAVQYSIDKLGERFAAIPVAAGVLDLSSRSDVSALVEGAASLGFK